LALFFKKGNNQIVRINLAVWGGVGGESTYSGVTIDSFVFA